MVFKTCYHRGYNLGVGLGEALFFVPVVAGAKGKALSFYVKELALFIKRIERVTKEIETLTQWRDKAYREGRFYEAAKYEISRRSKMHDLLVMWTVYLQHKIREEEQWITKLENHTRRRKAER